MGTSQHMELSEPTRANNVRNLLLSTSKRTQVVLEIDALRKKRRRMKAKPCLHEIDQEEREQLRRLVARLNSRDAKLTKLGSAVLELDTLCGEGGRMEEQEEKKSGSSKVGGIGSTLSA